MFKKIYKALFHNRFLLPLFELRPQNLPAYFRYIAQYRRYKHIPHAEPLSLSQARPILGEDTEVQAIDHHYFYQGLWAAKKILQQRPVTHVDVASRAEFVGFLTTATHVKYVDIRPLEATIENFENVQGSILDLPFANNSTRSLSCLHVAEHIGLGRYGDLLDPEGTKKACLELARVLAPGGDLYFSLPIGEERVQFNAHRIHDPKTIKDYFSTLHLVSFSAINDAGTFIHDARLDDYTHAKYACGLFHFTKK